VSVGYNYRLAELCSAVALAQLERIEDLVNVRIQAARLFGDAIAGCDWLEPQRVPDGCTHSYWTFVARLVPGSVPWREFRDAFVRNGGHGIYAAWKLTYQEPAFRQVQFDRDQTQTYDTGLCPVAESVQPFVLQFKTNYWDCDHAQRQADILRKTVGEFHGKRG
jgi:perosamine synthetase